ncbi:TPA: hypothetical protein EYP44_04690, partial [Candidatus Bathyarchaeota archaeon]|nr:hypothetical protein [Candidatus Bathyarchaeota archaeon]
MRSRNSTRAFLVLFAFLLGLALPTGAAGTADNDDVVNVIVTHSLIADEAERLADWKARNGISSEVVTVEWIYDAYDGADGPERIRNFLREYVAEHNTSYVTVFGDFELVPARRAYVPDGYNVFVPTDLYYADLDEEWDQNGDGKHADIGVDVVNLRPELAVGRLPASDEDEARALVDKIIRYETEAHRDKAWFRRALLIGDDSFPQYPGAEGEAIAEAAASEIPEGWEALRFYGSGTGVYRDIIYNHIQDGAHLVLYVGHGGPDGWYTAEERVFSASDASELANGHRLPVIFAMADYTAWFDGRDCVGEGFLLNPGGGAIGYVGATRVAYGEPELYETIGNAALSYLATAFVDGLFGSRFLGDAWRALVDDYLLQYPVPEADDPLSTEEEIREKMALQYVLLGDPTLSLEGYPAMTSLSVTSSSVIWGHDVSIVARLTDYGGRPLADKPIIFELYHNGAWHVIGESTTDPDGYARLRCPILVASGTYQLRATFNGDARYRASSSAGILTVRRGPTSMSMAPSIVATYSDSATIAAMLLDDRGEPASGKPVRFEYRVGPTWAGLGEAVTGDDGRAALAVESIELVPGRYPLRAIFDGDEFCLSAAAESELVVGKETTVVTVAECSVEYGESVELQARVTDDELIGIQGVELTLWVYVDGSWRYLGSAVTGADGHASLPYRASLMPGSYKLGADFAGDARYRPSNGFAQLVVEKVSTSITCTVTPSRITYGENATIGGSIDPNPGAGFPVTLQYSGDGGETWGAVATVTTGPDGSYMCPWSPAAPGPYLLKASWGGDRIYGGAESPVVSLSARILTVLSAPPSTAVVYGDEGTVRARLVDGEGNPVVGGVVHFHYWDGLRWVRLGDSEADGEGYATLAFIPLIKPGRYDLRATFDGDDYRLPTEAKYALAVNRETTVMTVFQRSVDFRDSATLRATVTDDELSVIEGAELTFWILLNGSWVSLGSTVTATDGAGVVEFTADFRPGAYTIRVAFGGDDYYEGAVKEVPECLIVEREATVLEVVAPQSVELGQEVTIEVRAVDDEG